ncbi:MAG: TadE/TadG family type IV pilus assembly protein [Terricaulis sp.]
MTVGFALKLSRGFRAFRLPAFYAPASRRFSDRSGGAAVEFAIVGPVLFLLMTGIFTYGGYFLTAHTIQQLANDAARASIAGLDDEERLTLARETMLAGIANQSFMRGELSRLELRREGATISLAVTYDASEDVYWAFQTLIPAPPSTISRNATILMGGF